jgi:thioredoxin reductase (NADPH)
MKTGSLTGNEQAGEISMKYDVVVIGGGIAGLQASIQLARSLRSVLVIDHHRGRSVVAKQYRNLLGFPDGVSGEALRHTGRQQAERFGVRFIRDEAVSLEQDGSGQFLVKLKATSPNTVCCKTIVMATGITDVFPVIPGLSECLGESVFICPDCDGYEIVNQEAAVIGDGPHAVALAGVLTRFSRKLIIVNHTGTALATEQLENLRSWNIPLLEAQVERMEQESGRLHALHLSTGDRLEMTRAFLSFPGAQPNTTLLEPFPVERNEQGYILVDPRTRESSFRNIWAVGDIVAHSQMASIAMGDGAQAAIWINKRLLEEA